jgi:membrane associated rhomboid family serine protease
MFRSIPPVTRALILINAAVYLLQFLAPQTLLGLLALWPLADGFQPWQVVTYAFLHDTHSFAHIFFNMFALFMFGGPLEIYWGRQRFIACYAASIIAAAATQLTMQALSHTGEPVIGASGGVFGLLLGFAWFFPRQRIILLFPPIPMPAWLFVTLYGVLELVLGVTGVQASVAHFAHLGGMLGGAITILIWRGQDAARARRTPPRRS